MSVAFPPWPKNAAACENLWTGGVNGPPSLEQKTSPPHGFPHGFGRHPCGRRLNKIG